MPTMKRITRFRGDLATYFGAEDDKHYRGVYQDMTPVLEHVRHMTHKVNEAPAAGNRNGWRYGGSIPLSVLTDWCHKRGVTFDMYARNEGGLKDEFKRYLKAEFSKFLAAHHTGARARPTIAVPSVYRSRRVAEALSTYRAVKNARPEAAQVPS